MFILTQTDDSEIYISGINVNTIVQNKKTARLYMIGGLQVNVKERAAEVAYKVSIDLGDEA